MKKILIIALLLFIYSCSLEQDQEYDWTGKYASKNDACWSSVPDPVKSCKYFIEFKEDGYFVDSAGNVGQWNDYDDNFECTFWLNDSVNTYKFKYYNEMLIYGNDTLIKVF